MLEGYILGTLKIFTFVAIALNLVHPRQGKATRLVLGIVLISVIMLPIVNIIGKSDEFVMNDSFWNSLGDNKVDDATVEEFFERGIEEYIASECGVAKENVRVRADGFDIASLKATRIYVSISSGGAFVDYRALEDKLEREFTNGGDCRIELLVG